MKPKWHASLVLICEKCGKKLNSSAHSPSQVENPSSELKDWLKKKLLERSLWGSSRVVLSSCLDICPNGKIAIAYTSDRPDLETFAETVDPIEDRSLVLEHILDRATRSAVD